MQIDPLRDQIPTGARAVAYVVEWTPYPSADRETRRLDPTLMGPADDRISLRCTEGQIASALQAIDKGGPIGSMVLWLCAGRQSDVVGETPQSVEHLFTIENMSRGQWTVKLELELADDPEDGGAVDPQDRSGLPAAT